MLDIILFVIMDVIEWLIAPWTKSWGIVGNALWCLVIFGIVFLMYYYYT